MLSIIVPAYNEEQMVPLAEQAISQLMQQENIPYELLFVNDGSKDSTWAQICHAAEKNKNVVGVNFSRNFGKEAAMFAGLEKASGDCCVIIDCDLQHPPEKIVEMYRLWQEGYEVVEGVKDDRGRESAAHRFMANTFYGIISKMTGFDMADSSDFKLLDRKVVDTLNQMKERNVFFRALSFWVGFKKAYRFILGSGAGCRSVKMEHKGSFQIRHNKHHIVFRFSLADSDHPRLRHVHRFHSFGRDCSLSKIRRLCPERFYNGHYNFIVRIQYNNDESRNYRAVYREDLHRMSRASEIYYLVGIPQRKR